MKYKTLYAAHETRMWAKTLLLGALALYAVDKTHPEVTDSLRRKWTAVKDKFKKKEEPKTIKIVVCDKDGNPV